MGRGGGLIGRGNDNRGEGLCLYAFIKQATMPVVKIEMQLYHPFPYPIISSI
jgi:hypothetical protein